jgi:HlyD family secretion protein
MGNPRRAYGWWIAAAALLSAAATVALWPRPVGVEVGRVDRGDVTVEAVDEGRVRMHEVYVLSAPVAGRVQRIEVEPGDAVREGDLLARLAPQAGAQPAAGLAVRAPAPGVVLEVPQRSETTVAAGAPLVVVGDPGRREVVVAFLSQEAVRIVPGAPARIENWGGPALAARVERVEPIARTRVSALGIEEQRTNVILGFESDGAGAALGHDFRIDARVVLRAHRGVLRLPIGAPFRSGAGWVVFRVVDDRAVLTPVELGDTDGSHHVLLAGLAEGDEVVAFPSSQVTDGVRLRRASR